MEEKKKYKILVSDDEEDILVLVKFRLQFAGYDVVEARDGEETLQKVKEEKPDLLLLDYRLPRGNGKELALKIKKEYGLHVPIIMFTASANVLESLHTTMADDCVLKPFKPEELLAKIETLLKKYYS